MSDTKDRILDAAEQAFADRGYAGASLRGIIAAAGVNLAAIHYHFGSKQELLRAVILRRVGPVNQERLALLDACERAAAPGAPPLEKVLQAFLLPTIRVARQPGGVIVRLMARLYVEDMLGRIAREAFSDVLDRFGAALGRALPELSRQELLWRALFAAGAMSQALRPPREVAEAAGIGSPTEAQATLDRLIAFLSAGFRAPVPALATQEQ